MNAGRKSIKDRAQRKGNKDKHKRKAKSNTKRANEKAKSCGGKGSGGARRKEAVRVVEGGQRSWADTHTRTHVLTLIRTRTRTHLISRGRVSLYSLYPGKSGHWVWRMLTKQGVTGMKANVNGLRQHSHVMKAEEKRS